MKNKKFILVLIVLSLPLFFIHADPFTGGLQSSPAPAASRAPVLKLPQFMVDLQLAFREKAADVLSALKSGKSTTALTIFFIVVFIYGILHAAGPGHRKTVIFSMFLSRDTGIWQPAAAGFMSAGLHAGSSVLLVLIFKYIFKAVSVFTSTSQFSFYMEGWTFILLSVFAVILILLKILEIRRNTEKTDKEQSGKNIYLVVLISSAFPCPGATMILLFALSQGMFITGILGVAAMSLGMGIVISAAGYLAMSGRRKLFTSLKTKEQRIKLYSDRLELASYVIVALFALWMGSPFIHYLAAGT